MTHVQWVLKSLVYILEIFRKYSIEIWIIFGFLDII